jgi:hypothetical protein
MTWRLMAAPAGVIAPPASLGFVAAARSSARTTSTVSPFGDVFIAEVGEGQRHLVGVTGHGATFFFAQRGERLGEFTGPNFSDDKRILSPTSRRWRSGHPGLRLTRASGPGVAGPSPIAMIGPLSPLSGAGDR